MGNMSFIKTVSFGRPADPRQKNCTQLTIRPVAGAAVRTMNVTCTGGWLVASCVRLCELESRGSLRAANWVLLLKA